MSHFQSVLEAMYRRQPVIDAWMANSLRYFGEIFWAMALVGMPVGIQN